MPLPSRRPSHRVEVTRSLLSSRGMSLGEIARQSQLRFPRSALFRIPSNFYDALRHASFSPRAHQLYALSVLTGYRLSDWMRVFGFSFDDAARFQASRPRYYTAELDPRVYDPSAEVVWFDETQPPALGVELTPLSQWLIGRTVRPLDSLAERSAASFRYLKIGSRDAYAFPDLLPGSIVRIATNLSPSQLLSQDTAKRILAIAHRRGIFCSRVRLLRRGRVVLCSRHLPYAPIELELGTDAQIVGYVDLELRRLDSQETPEVGASWRDAQPLRVPTPRTMNNRLGEFVRHARLRSGFSLREASERTAEIARALGNPAYFCAPGTLSDLEAQDLLPRHIHKWISLSAVYCLPIGALAARAGLPLEQTGRDPIPEDRDASRPIKTPPTLHPSPFLETIRQQFGEIPFFLHTALPDFSGLSHLSARDLFWAGATTELIHPYLRGSAFLAINRKSKSPAPSLSSPVWAQPLYVLELRSGRRLCAACSLQGGTLVVRPCTKVSGEILRLRNRVDVEVLGRVVAILRRV